VEKGMFCEVKIVGTIFLVFFHHGCAVGKDSLASS
jgi:hypothetical protein